MTGHVAQALSGERPFPGLRPFDFDDHDFFFGRSDQIASLYRLLDRNRFIAVVGSSGCGKSSLTRAGLLHVLEKENAESKLGKWVWCSMRPGEAPLDALTDALNGLTHHDDEMSEKAWSDRIATRLHSSSFGLAEALIEIGVAENDKFVLVVDQFEELFRYADQHVGEVHDKLREARVRNEAESFVELLLEARRSSKRDIRVLITMRSDFIGDCANFDGLPEAVSATQFLVPGMTREQYEQVIRQPIEKAGAEIDPKLVQQLLNDAGDETDELPVLQHCLQQLWEKAGSESSKKPAEAANGDERHEIATAVPAARHIELDHYDQIGKIAGALSQHADRILRGFPEAAVEAVFRALSEFKDGRAIRRPLQYWELHEESGIPEHELEAVVDRFRADDCSFLVTSPPGIAKVTHDTVIDVGHEALLRRWQQIRGVPGATGDSGDKRPIGWLRQERRDGQKYQILLSMLDSDDPSSKVDDIKRHWEWWNERTRTPSWAERYGGKYDQVVKLLRDGLAYRSNSQLRVALLAAFAGGLFINVMIQSYLQHVSEEDQASRYEIQRALAEQNRVLADDNFGLSVNHTKDFLDKVLSALNSGSIKAATAFEMEQAGEAAVSDFKNIEKSSRTQALEVALDNTATDILIDIGEGQAAFKRATAAKGLAESLVESDAGRSDWQDLLYESRFRFADALSEKDSEAALQEYRKAEEGIRKLAEQTPADGGRQYRLAFINAKIGDMIRDLGKYPDALKQFRKALDIADDLASRHPDNPLWLTYAPNIRSRIANVLSRLSEPDYEGAFREYDTAVARQEALAKRFPTDAVIKANLALSHRWRAETLSKNGRWEEARNEFKTAIALRQQLTEADSSNTKYVGYLAADYGALALSLIDRADKVEPNLADASPKPPGDNRATLQEALEARRNELQVRQKLADKDITNPLLGKNLDRTKKSVAELEARLQAGQQ